MASKEGFDLALSALRSRVEDVLIAVEDIAPATLGTFDLVLFLGVLSTRPTRCATSVTPARFAPGSSFWRHALTPWTTHCRPRSSTRWRR
jgi:hypothetical protein